MTFVVELTFREGAESRHGRREEHRDYWNDKARAGLLIGGGPWQDGSGELLLCEARDRDSLLRVLRADPYVRAQVIAHVEVREWNVMTGEALRGRRPAAADRRPAGGAGLTAHEERIAAMMVDGMTNRKIAEALTVSTRAVELHITRIYLKLSIRRRAQLAHALEQRHRNAA
ncbi:LuxR C-terminal-related transcriptional regulator [Streptomyces sp. BA2]|uniref:LuxR C-terminal-related transcriptional regulator n=1 Tax=Streptomyces sp. BA2 TaxID=436595 RepID=UPI001327E1D4|nr:LuxR C-terminal-related transcriptional regulator [Streptomyces sp. BA2]MWA08080.1 LuxR family transcriptional regulator [Streptomyces sp. BA2]